MPNQLYYGDNLDILRQYIPDESVHLIYLDPPFNTQRDFNIFFQDETGEYSDAQIKAFGDTWQWNAQTERVYQQLILRGDSLGKLIEALYPAFRQGSLLAYLVMMSTRLLELHRVLKPNGSLYLHCDPTASHYLKMIMDMIFTPDCFRNEIIWRRTGAHGKVKRYAPIHDTILFYTKHPTNFVWNAPKTPYMRQHVLENFLPDGDGYKTNYYGNVLTGSGVRNGESGKPWRGIDPTAKGRHWAVPRRLIEDSGEDMSALSPHQKLDRLYELGYIRLETGAAWPIYEHRITPQDGLPMSDLWSYQPYTQKTVFGGEQGIDEDVRWLHPKDQERLGYPTQKPVGLLKRIVAASSNQGDVVLDPFCGCGTTIDAAQDLGRQWIGIDITHLSIALLRYRLNRFGQTLAYEVHGIPKDIGGAKALAEQDRHEFEWWALSLVGARPVGSSSSDTGQIKKGKKGADQGRDGIITFLDASSVRTKQAIVQVKSGKNIGVAEIRDLLGTITREKAEVGIFISLYPLKPTMYTEAAKAGQYDAGLGRFFDRIQLYSIEELMTGAKRLDLPMHRTTYKPAQPAEVGNGDQLDLI